MKNLFITFEGIEGCGKSTQAKLLAEYFESINCPVKLTREPGGVPIAEKIRELLLDVVNEEMTPETELLLFLAARAQHTKEKIIPALTEGYYVISDRYFDSTFAYQGAARHLDIEMVKYMNYFATDGLIPDLTFIIDLPVEIALERIKFKKMDRMEKQALDFHNRVRASLKKRIQQLFQYHHTVKEAFADIAFLDYYHTYLEKQDSQTGRYIVLDGNKDIYDLHNEIKEIVNKKNEEK